MQRVHPSSNSLKTFFCHYVTEFLSLHWMKKLDFPPYFWIAEMHSFLVVYNTLGQKWTIWLVETSFSKRCPKTAIQAPIIPDRLTLKQPGTQPMKYGPEAMVILKASKLSNCIYQVLKIIFLESCSKECPFCPKSVSPKSLPSSEHCKLVLLC